MPALRIDKIVRYVNYDLLSNFVRMRLVGTADDGGQFYFAWGCFRNFVLPRLRKRIRALPFVTSRSGQPCR
jgi:hypothetical protein